MSFDNYQTLILAVVVLLIGKLLNKIIPFLNKYSIPIPVSGGIFIAILTTVLYYTMGLEFTFTSSARVTAMLIFFASIGLSADFRKLAIGGPAFVLLLIAAGILVIVQNLVGVGLAELLGINKLYGLLAGSISLTGGHGTAAAWAQTFINDGVDLPGAREIAIAAATFGLVLGGLIGGPVGEFLIKRRKLKSTDADQQANIKQSKESVMSSLMNTDNLFSAVACLVAALWLGTYIHSLMVDYKVNFLMTLPQFVYVLFSGVVIRAILDHIFRYNVRDEAISSLGNLGLYFFIAMALLGLKLWTVFALAVPVLIILIIQTIIIILFVIFITYTFMGRKYDAAVISAGHVGFGLGATPTAIANMQAVTNKHGPSYKAFLIIPLVGAFFIDLINNAVITLFYHWFG